MFYISSVSYIFSSLVALIFGFKNYQAFRRTNNQFSKNMAIAITSCGLALLIFGLIILFENQIVYTIGQAISYLFLFVAFEYFFVISFGYINLRQTAQIVQIIYFIWIISIIILFLLGFGAPKTDKYGLIFWNSFFPLNWISFFFVFLVGIINFLVFLKIAREEQERLIKLRSLFIALAFLFAACGGAFEAITTSGNYYIVFIANGGLFLGFISLLLAIYYRKAEVKKKLKVAGTK